MKTRKMYRVHPALLWVAIPAAVLLLIMVFSQPALQTEGTLLFRPQDEPCTPWAFQVGIRDNVLVQSNYTVKTGEGNYTAVISLEGSDRTEVYSYETAGSPCWIRR